MSAETLVVAPNWVGDLVMAQPTLAALAASGRRLTVLARPHLQPLLRLLPEVGTGLERTGDAATVAALRRATHREAVILPNSFRAAWLAFRAGIPERWAYRGNLRSPLLSRPVPRPRGGARRHQVEDYRALLAAMGAELADRPEPRIGLPPEARAAAAERLRRTGLPEGGGPLIGLFPGAEFGPSKRWPEERFIELARALRKTSPAPRLLVLAGPKELWLAVKIHEAVGRAAPVVGPDLDLSGLAGVLGRLDLLVTNDSGPMHLAAALQVPCVALFGPTDPRRTAPVGDSHTVLYDDRWCSPCFKRRCPLLHHRCLRRIDAHRVLEAAARTLP